MKFIIIVLSSILFLTCTHENITEDGITGTWKLVEYCVSPGDASCNMQKATFDQIFIFANNEFSLQSDNNNCSGNYEIVEDNLSLSKFEPSSCYGEILFLTTIDKNTIEINPRCFEPCRYIYKKQ